MSKLTEEDILEHHGTKGMKWGVRRSRGGKSGGTATSSHKSASSMSDHELRSVINRMQMERQYNSLTSGKSSSKKGAEFASSVLLNVARTQATQILNAQVNKAMSGRK